MIKISSVVIEVYLDHYVKLWTIDWVDHLGAAQCTEFSSGAEAVKFWRDLRIERRLRESHGSIAFGLVQ